MNLKIKEKYYLFLKNNSKMKIIFESESKFEMSILIWIIRKLRKYPNYNLVIFG